MNLLAVGPFDKTIKPVWKSLFALASLAMFRSASFAFGVLLVQSVVTQHFDGQRPSSQQLANNITSHGDFKSSYVFSPWGGNKPPVVVRPQEDLYNPWTPETRHVHPTPSYTSTTTPTTTSSTTPRQPFTYDNTTSKPWTYNKDNEWRTRDGQFVETQQQHHHSPTSHPYPSHHFPHPPHPGRDHPSRPSPTLHSHQEPRPQFQPTYRPTDRPFTFTSSYPIMNATPYPYDSRNFSASQFRSPYKSNFDNHGHNYSSIDFGKASSRPVANPNLKGHLEPHGSISPLDKHDPMLKIFEQRMYERFQALCLEIRGRRCDFPSRSPFPPPMSNTGPYRRRP